jgi:hypothetical protein
VTTTQWASLALGLGAGWLIWWLFWLPGRWVYRLLWRYMPDSKFKTFLLKEREGQWITIHRPGRPPDQ